MREFIAEVVTAMIGTVKDACYIVKCKLLKFPDGNHYTLKIVRKQSHLLRPITDGGEGEPSQEYLAYLGRIKKKKEFDAYMKRGYSSTNHLWFEKKRDELNELMYGYRKPSVASPYPEFFREAA